MTLVETDKLRNDKQQMDVASPRVDLPGGSTENNYIKFLRHWTTPGQYQSLVDQLLQNFRPQHLCTPLMIFGVRVSELIVLTILFAQLG